MEYVDYIFLPLTFDFLTGKIYSDQTPQNVVNAGQPERHLLSLSLHCIRVVISTFYIEKRRKIDPRAYLAMYGFQILVLCEQI